MAVNQSGRIDAVDMAGLASYANGVAGLGKGVLPMFYEAVGGARYGHRRVRLLNIKASNLGTGYQVGEQLTGPAGSLFNIEAVNSAGGVIGIKMISFGGYWGEPSVSDPASPWALTGGSGSGAMIEFDLQRHGPDEDYSFPAAPIPGYGYVTDFGIETKGANYQSGDVLTFSELPSASITVNTVDAAGGIVTCTENHSANLVSIPANMNSLAAVGGSGSGAVFYGLFKMPELPQWKTELERLRFNALASNMPVPASDKYMSGPWPKSGYGTSGFDLNSKQQAFYYEDTGSPEWKSKPY